MGWFDSWWSGGDHLRDVDPEIRKFLEQQQPGSSYQPPAATPSFPSSSSSSSPPSQEPGTYREQMGLKDHVDPEAQYAEQQALKAARAAGNAPTEQERPLPAESLYQDGRYKHLWKTYRPQQEVDDAGKSDQEKLLDIVHVYKDRRAGVRIAAMENCSNEQWAVHECFRTGSWSARFTMCRAENRELNRCVDLQSRFLKALGYASLDARSDSDAEKIQMHADGLYQRMVKHEKAVEEARKNGLPIPDADFSLSAPSNTNYNDDVDAQTLRSAATDGQQQQLPPPPPKRAFTWDSLPQELKDKSFETRLKGLEGAELELEKRALEQEIMLSQDLVTRVNARHLTEHKERLQRIEDGNQRFSDRLKGWLDQRDYDAMEKSRQLHQQQQQQQQSEKS